MASQSPTVTGFKMMLRRPVAGLAEIAWRWTFGTAAIGLLLFTLLEYLDTLPVTSRDLLLLRTGRRSLIMQGLAHILHGSGPRLLTALALVAMSLMAGWVVIASAGRFGTLSLLKDELSEGARAARGRFGSLVGLNALKALILAAAISGLIAVVILTRSLASISTASGVLVFLILAALLWSIRSSLDRMLNLAALFVIADGEYARAAFVLAVSLYRNRRGQLLVAGTWFGLARFTAFVIAGSLATSSLALAGVLPAGVALLGALVVVLLYFAVSDYLSVGKLAAQLAIISQPTASAFNGGRIASGMSVDPSFTARVDPDELILSDVPIE